MSHHWAAHHWSAHRWSAHRWAAIVLAAGAGTRMGSDVPKPLHQIAGRAMLLRVLDALADVDAHPVVVVIGHGADRVRSAVTSDAPNPNRLAFAHQTHLLGTGDAARVGLLAFDDDATATDVVVLPGDTPLLRASTVAELVSVHDRDDAAATLLTVHFDDPTGYGRIVRSDDGGIAEIVEQRDARPEQAEINEVNTGFYCFRIAALRAALRRLQPTNTQSEYYLTDVIGILAASGASISAVTVADPTEAMGVNDADQLAACEHALVARSVAQRQPGPKTG